MDTLNDPSSVSLCQGVISTHTTHLYTIVDTAGASRVLNKSKRNICLPYVRIMVVGDILHREHLPVLLRLLILRPEGGVGLKNV